MKNFQVFCINQKTTAKFTIILSRMIFMKTRTVLLLAVIASTALLESQQAIAFTLTTNASVTQFGSPDTQTFTGSNTVFQTLPSVSSSQVSTNGAITTNAFASPNLLTASFSISNSGINSPIANAQFYDTSIVFQNNQALVDLIGSSGTGLDLLLNFNVSYQLSTPQAPGLFNQALAFANVNFGASSFGAISFKSGTASSINGPIDRTFSNTGVFEGLPENGGSLTVQLPINISPILDNRSLSVFFSAFADVNGLSLADSTNGNISVSIPKLPLFVTLLDGTSASAAGLQYGLTPSVTPMIGEHGEETSDGGRAEAVSEPSEIAGTLFALTLFGLGYCTRKKRLPLGLLSRNFQSIK
ncbi:MAG: hypothetical protein NW220_13115 [Leptolyngbyaceae cyanobacterium bins.349]|nr:hypothetical protein [Leptolyngbyaceae cyanobacterium bins.349]